MSAIKSQKSVLFKVLGSFLIFLTFLSLLVVIGLHLAGVAPINLPNLASLNMSSPSGTDGVAPEPLFYRSIGQAPIAASASGSGAGRFTIEIAEVYSESEARTIISDLAQQGVEAYFTPYTHSGKVIFRVRRGVFVSERRAAEAANQLLKNKNIAGTVIRL